MTDNCLYQGVRPPLLVEHFVPKNKELLIFTVQKGETVNSTGFDFLVSLFCCLSVFPQIQFLLNNYSVLMFS